MSNPLPGPMITFWTKAPENAPEVKGYNCYFKPERLEWRARTFRQGEGRIAAAVVAHGPATRVKHRQGAMHWVIEGTSEGDTRPPWLLLPLDQLTRATLTVEELAKDTDERVDAATRALRRPLTPHRAYGYGDFEDAALASLSAVLPDIIRQAKAEAWDEGYSAGHEDARAVQPTYPQPTLNPHEQGGQP